MHKHWIAPTIFPDAPFLMFLFPRINTEIGHIKACQQKKAALQSAEIISVALDRKMNELFDIVSLSPNTRLSPKTINHYHTFIHSFLESARKEELVNVNVADLSR